MCEILLDRGGDARLRDSVSVLDVFVIVRRITTASKPLRTVSALNLSNVKLWVLLFFLSASKRTLRVLHFVCYNLQPQSELTHGLEDLQTNRFFIHDSIRRHFDGTESRLTNALSSRIKDRKNREAYLGTLRVIEAHVIDTENTIIPN